MTIAEPTVLVEAELLARANVVIGIDEVGRGAIAGPLAVGVLAIGADQLDRGAPAGLRDSKLCTPRMRDRLAPECAQWSLASAVGWASAAEIDEFGITACLAAAAIRGLGDLHTAGVVIPEAAILLDGTHDWLSPALDEPLDVTVRAKADRDCVAVAAASVVAKVARDRLMVERSAGSPEYGWENNKGYASAPHCAAIRAWGPGAEHRRTWLGRILAADA